MKKKLISLTVCLAMILSFVNFSLTVFADTNFTGSGTEDDPYLIGTAADLTNLASLTNATATAEYAGKFYKLTADIDMQGISYMPISWGTSMYTAKGARFTGTFDGDGHIVRNISIPAAYAQNYGATAGLIGILGTNGAVKNLGIENMTVTTGSATYMCIGGIAGSLMAGMSIDRCYVRGMTVSGTAGSPAYVGGLIGRTIGNAGTITNCYTTGISISLSNDANHSAGIMGSCGNTGYTATSCYTTHTKVEGYTAATNSYLTKTNCYASGTIADATVANLGVAFKADSNFKNGGYPLLLWESEAAFAGSGTEAEPYIIGKPADLTMLSSLTNTAASAALYADKYYKLTADLNMSGISYKPISWGTSMSTASGARFTGTLDGDGHIIRNISIPASHLSTYGATAGLIGIMGTGGAVINLGIENMSITTGSATYMCIGGIAGSLAANGMSIDSCYVRGMTVNGTAGSPAFVGGLVGRTIGSLGAITNSYSTGLSFTLANDANHSGGIMGSCGNTGYTATNCYTSYSKIEGWTAATNTYITKSNCYALSDIGNATAANLGAAFKKNTGISNSGYTLLAWEEPESYEGAGTDESPYLIRNATELVILSNLSNSADEDMKVFASKYYKLTADIDLQGISYKPISWGTSMTTAQGARFTGTLDGDGHIIRNINIPAAYAQNYGATVGLIGILGTDGAVKNLGIENMTITTGSASYLCIGGIAGDLAANGMSIDKCYVRGITVNGTTAVSPAFVGGLVGRTAGNAGTITNSYSTGISFNLSNAGNSGGIIGSCGNTGYSAANCYTTYSKVQGNAAATNSYMQSANCYAGGATAAQLGLNYITVSRMNGGDPILVWEYEKMNPGAAKVAVTVSKQGDGFIDFQPEALPDSGTSVYPGQGLGFTLTPRTGYVVTKVNYEGEALTADSNGKYLFDVNGAGTLVVVFTTPTAQDITLYVSGSGSDANAGTSERSPLKTVQTAILASRAVTGNKTINLADGEYSAKDTIALSDLDDNITFKAYQGGKVVFAGGNKIEKSLFTAYSENILVADLSYAGITDFGSIKSIGYGSYANVSDMGYNPVVTIDGEYQMPARYPNSGYMSANSIVTGSSNTENLSFTTSDTDASRWQAETNMGVFGYFANGWADLSSGATVAADGTISVGCKSAYGADTANTRFFVFNVLSELDTEGEYYIDTAEGKLYIYKPAAWDSVEEICFAANNKPIVTVNDAVNAKFEGINFTDTNSYAIKAANASGISVTDCEFAGIGKDALYITDSNNAVIRGNKIKDIGVSGIRYVNGGSRSTLLQSGTVIADNDISYVGNQRHAGAYAVDISNSVGVTISGNKLHDLQHGAILYNTCNDTVIEYNEISNTDTDVSDAGAIYSGRDWTTRGNIIRYNYFHDITGGEIQAIYLDDQHSSTEAYKNVFYNVSQTILIGGGRNNTFKNNLIIDTGSWLQADARGTRASEDSYNYLVSRLNQVPYQSAAWNKYSNMSDILEDSPRSAKYNVIQDNVVYNCSNYFLYPLDNFTSGNTLVSPTAVSNTSFFLDYANGEFAPSASANTISATAYNAIKDIPFDKMGFATNTVKVKAFDLTETGGNLTASASVKNYTGEAKLLQLLIAQYNEDNELITASRKQLSSVAAGAEATDSITTAKDENAKAVKAFLWTNGFEPLCENK